jgi:catechol 2,3-dioxygenase-like lactoylglutathione lyase family enzyme
MPATKFIASLGVSDIERSLGFYRSFLGFEVVDSYDADGRMAWCWLRAQGAELMLQQLSADQQIRLNPAIGQSWVVYVRVDDFDALHAKLARGGFPVSEIARTSYGTREFFVPDPDGYELWISVPEKQDETD